MTRLVQFFPAAILIFIAICTGVEKSVGQDADSLGLNNFVDFHSFPEQLKNFHYQRDSILGESYFYDILKQTEINLPRSGNPGSAHFDFFRSVQNNKFITDGFSQFDGYFLDPFREKSESSQRRFSNINYHLGSKKEQHIMVRHEQKIKPWMIAGLDLGAMISESDYTRSRNNNRNFDLYFQYESRSKIYRGYASYTANRALNEENGGISNDAEFEDASSLNTRTLSINLHNAENKYKTHDYVLKQEVNLSRLFRAKDTTAQNNSFKEGSLILGHYLWWNRKSVLFTSSISDSVFFDHVYLDTTVTYDSSFYNDLYQNVLLEYSLKRGNTIFSVGTGIEYQDVKYTTGPADTSFMSGAAFVTASFRMSMFHSAVSFSKSVTDDFRDVYRSQLQLDYKNDKLIIYFSGGASRKPQVIRDQFYVSNHFIWSNNFEDQQEYDIVAGAWLTKAKTGINFRSRTIKNLVFYMDDFLPQSDNDYVTVNEIALSNGLKAGKFGIDDRIAFSFTGNEQVAPVPLCKFFVSLYYENRFFKQVLGFKAGIDANYYSAYYGYGYMPATGIFYVQHEKQIGNYPEIGAFVTLRIKQAARLFIRLDNLNAGISSRDYYGAVHYPLPGRTFKFGISWDLVD